MSEGFQSGLEAVLANKFSRLQWFQDRTGLVNSTDWANRAEATNPISLPKTVCVKFPEKSMNPRGISKILPLLNKMNRTEIKQFTTKVKTVVQEVESNLQFSWSSAVQRSQIARWPNCVYTSGNQQ